MLNQWAVVVIVGCEAGLKDVVASLKIGLLDHQQELHQAQSDLDSYVKHTHDSLKLTRWSRHCFTQLAIDI